MSDDQVIELCSVVLTALLDGTGVSRDDVAKAQYACQVSMNRLQALREYSLLTAEPFNRIPL